MEAPILETKSDNRKPEITPSKSSHTSSLFRWFKLLISLCLFVSVALVTSLHFQWTFDQIIYPQLGISVGETRARPLYSMTLKDIKFEDSSDQANTINELQLDYNLLYLLLGRIKVSNALVKDAKISLNSFFVPNEELKQPSESSKTLSGDSLYPNSFIGLEIDSLTLQNVALSLSDESLIDRTLQIQDTTLDLTDFSLASGGKLELQFNLDSKPINADSVQSLHGSLSSQIALSEEANSISLKSKIDVSKLQYNNETINLNDVDIDIQAHTNFTRTGLVLKEGKLVLKKLETVLVDTIFDARIPFNDDEFKADINIRAIDDEVQTLFPELLFPIKEGQTTGNLSVRYSSSKTFGVKGALEASDVVLNAGNQSSSPPLKLSTDFDLDAINNEYSLKSLAFKVDSGERQIADLALSATLEKLTSLTASIESSLLDLDSIISIASSFSVSEDDKQSAQSMSSDQKNPTEGDNQLPSIPIDLDIDLDLKEASFKGIAATGIKTKVTNTEGVLSIPLTEFNINEAPASFKVTMNTAQSENTLSGMLEVGSFDLLPIVKSFNPEVKDDFSGKVERFRFILQRKNDIRGGDIRVSLKDLEVPSYLQDVPPLNLLFLPITALDYTVGNIGGALLPSAITDLTSSLRNTVKGSGQLAFDTAQIRIFMDKEKLTLQETNFNGRVIPTLHFNGEIEYDRDVDLVIGIELLKIPVPLTVGGTLDTPLPNLISFPTQVVKALGLGLVNIGGVFTKKDENEFFDSKEGLSLQEDEIDKK